MNELLLELLTGECCCPCGCDDPYHLSASVRDAVPAPHPMMFGKKMRPISIPGDDIPFVPPIFPSRESPQLTEPGSAPQLDGTGEYATVKISGEVGFSTGLMLDDGTLLALSGGAAQIDHQGRTARVFSGTITISVALTASTGPFNNPAYRTQAQIDTANAQPALKGVFPAPTISGATGNVAQATKAAADAAIPDGYSTLLPTGRYLNSTTGPERGVGSSTVSYNRTDTYQEANGIFFSGAAFVPAGVSASTAGSNPGTNVNVGVTIFRSAAYTLYGNNTYDLGHDALEYLPLEADLRWMIVSYLAAGVPTRDYFIYSATLPSATGTYGAVYVAPPPDNYLTTSQALTLAGVLVRASVGLTGTDLPSPVGSVFSYGSDVLASAVLCTYKGDSNATYQNGKSHMDVWTVNNTAIPVLPSPIPPFSFRSPVVNGHFFEIRHGSNGRTTDLINILYGREVWVDGALLGNAWESWSCFQDANGITLLLEDSSNLTVIPGLDVSKQVVIDWTSFFTSVRRPGETHRTLSTHPGHHTFPEDRAYLLLTSGVWLVLGGWDAYRDVPANEWTAAKLSKPKTRAAYIQSQQAVPPAPIPPRPAHGLALWDVR